MTKGSPIITKKVNLLTLWFLQKPFQAFRIFRIQKPFKKPRFEIRI